MKNSDDHKSIITQAMLDWSGTVSPPLTSPEISASDIRRAAIAIYWPDVPPRIYWDAEYADNSVWKGLIAPEEMNPFAWMVGRAHVGPQPERINSEQDTLENLRAMKPPGGLANFLFGGGESEYFTMMRPGDTITSVITAGDIYEKSGSTGVMLFYITHETWTNQKDQIIKKTKTTNIEWE